jgi:hypothetical protein
MFSLKLRPKLPNRNYAPQRVRPAFTLLLIFMAVSPPFSAFEFSLAGQNSAFDF